MHRYRISEIGQKVTAADFRPLDVLLVGATGVGKSPTLKGRYWDKVLHQPQPNLQQFLDEKAESVQKRILEATGLQISRPVYYSAYENYHLEEIMDAVINHIPVCRRKMHTL